jgi:hypothetical protein
VLPPAVPVGRARRQAANVAPTIQKLQASCVTTLQGIADELNKLGIPTASGRGEWQAVQVARVLARLAG